MRRLNRTGRTRGARRARDAPQIQGNNQRLALRARKRNVRRIRHAPRAISIHAALRHHLEHGPAQSDLAAPLRARCCRSRAPGPIPPRALVPQSRRHSPCRGACPARDGRRQRWARCASRFSHTALLRPWVHKFCARKSKANRSPSRATSNGSLPADCTAST